MSKKKFDSDNFLTICNRVKKELGEKFDRDLIEIIEVPQPTFSRRKADDDFPVEWAYSISIKSGLLVRWILTGQGPKRAGNAEKADYFVELERWAKEISGSGNLEWLRNQIEAQFPAFKKWKQEKEKVEGDSVDYPSSKVA